MQTNNQIIKNPQFGLIDLTDMESPEALECISEIYDHENVLKYAAAMHIICVGVMALEFYSYKLPDQFLFFQNSTLSLVPIY